MVAWADEGHDRAENSSHHSHTPHRILPHVVGPRTDHRAAVWHGTKWQTPHAKWRLEQGGSPPRMDWAVTRAPSCSGRGPSLKMGARGVPIPHPLTGMCSLSSRSTSCSYKAPGRSYSSRHCCCWHSRSRRSPPASRAKPPHGHQPSSCLASTEMLREEGVWARPSSPTPVNA